MTVYSQIGQQPLVEDVSPYGPKVVTLVSMAREILAALEQVALSAGVDLPDRRVVYMTPLPADCAQAGVLFSGWQLENTNDDMVVCQNERWLGRFSVLITRNSPAIPADEQNPKPPSTAKMLQAAMIASQDAELLISLLSGLGEVSGSATIETPATEGGLQSVLLSVLLPAV